MQKESVLLARLNNPGYRRVAALVLWWCLVSFKKGNIPSCTHESGSCLHSCEWSCGHCAAPMLTVCAGPVCLPSRWIVNFNIFSSKSLFLFQECLYTPEFWNLYLRWQVLKWKEPSSFSCRCHSLLLEVALLESQVTNQQGTGRMNVRKQSFSPQWGEHSLEGIISSRAVRRNFAILCATLMKRLLKKKSFPNNDFTLALHVLMLIALPSREDPFAQPGSVFQPQPPEVAGL